MGEYCNNKFFIQGVLREYINKVPQANLMSESCQRDLAAYISEKIQEQKNKI
jgi:orotate phosphoribosyltransferase-like protein